MQYSNIAKSLHHIMVILIHQLTSSLLHNI